MANGDGLTEKSERPATTNDGPFSNQSRAVQIANGSIFTGDYGVY